MSDELRYLIDHMDQDLELRHNKMMFAFSTVIAAMAIVFTTKSSNYGVWICVLSYAILVPFQARTSYSRLAHARMEAYMQLYHKDEIPYLTIPLGELDSRMGAFVGFLTNCELIFLTLAVEEYFSI